MDAKVRAVAQKKRRVPTTTFSPGVSTISWEVGCSCCSFDCCCSLDDVVCFSVDSPEVEEEEEDARMASECLFVVRPNLCPSCKVVNCGEIVHLNGLAEE